MTTFRFPLHRFRSLPIAWLIATAVVISTACGGDSTSSAAATRSGGATPSSSFAPSALSVNVKVFKFDPTPLTVAVGTKVNWMNNDEILHTVTSGAPGQDDGKFNGEMNGQGTSFTFVFTTPGTYTYFCSRHNGMRGEVDVS